MTEVSAAPKRMTKERGQRHAKQTLRLQGPKEGGLVNGQVPIEAEQTMLAPIRLSSFPTACIAHSVRMCL